MMMANVQTFNYSKTIHSTQIEYYLQFSFTVGACDVFYAFMLFFFVWFSLAHS